MTKDALQIQYHYDLGAILRSNHSDDIKDALAMILYKTYKEQTRKFK